ncbi:hypothetical protein PTSG_05167 [Salpingoeca rosetta]|uniref:Uncharacterized protein n=1 Tax=Salpingoeca rosetta (strain ATCC 50818 / BSB-021) TaxID=946362 RepID=F2UAP8_SALR5|nr:uncharacterized protein PTSG_05167 [Salpingoeca rosetta]EGD73464.1 hypothetical protein PTSG_05167 [Salpingoeca rosetta]|eukprot:XP_004993746.1 hypothetical protein PTSG_05167 [Salpingoeca rosetta]
MALREVRMCEWRERDDASLATDTAGMTTLVSGGTTRHLFWKVQGTRVLLQDQCHDVVAQDAEKNMEDINYCDFNAGDEIVPDISILNVDNTLLVIFVTASGTLYRLQFNTSNMHTEPYLTECTHMVTNTGCANVARVDVDEHMLVLLTSEGALYLVDATGDQQAIPLFQPAIMQRFLSFFRTSQAGEPQGDAAQAATSCFHNGTHVTLSVHHNHTLRIITTCDDKAEVQSTLAIPDLTEIDDTEAIAPENYLLDNVLLQGDRLQVALYVSAGDASQVVVLIVDLQDGMRVSVDRRILGAPAAVESLAVGLSEVAIMATTRDDDDVLTTHCAVSSLSSASLRPWTPVFKDTVLSTSLVIPPFLSAREVYADHILHGAAFSQTTLATALCTRSDLTADIVAEMSLPEIKDALVLAVEDHVRIVLAADTNTAVEARVYQEKEAECWQTLLHTCVQLEERQHRGTGIRFDVANDCLCFFTQADVRLLVPCHPLEDLYFRTDILVEEMPFDEGTAAKYPSSTRKDVHLLMRAAHDISDMLPAEVTSSFIKGPMRASEALARGLLDGSALPAATAVIDDVEAGNATLDIKMQLAPKLRGIRDISGAVSHVIHALKLRAQPALDAVRTSLSSPAAIRIISRRCAQLVETLALLSRDILVTAHIASATRDLALSGHKRFRDLPRLLRELCQLCSAYTRVHWCCTTIADQASDTTLLQRVMEMMTLADRHRGAFAPMDTEAQRREDRCASFVRGVPHWSPRAQSDWLRLGMMMEAASRIVLCAVASDLQSTTADTAPHFAFEGADGATSDTTSGACALLVSRSLLAREELSLLRDYTTVVGAGAVDVGDDAYKPTPALAALLTYTAALAHIETRAISKGVALLKSCFAQLSGIHHAVRANAIRLLPPLQFKLPQHCSDADRAQLFLLRFVEHCYRVLEQTLPPDLFSLDDELKAQYMARFQAAFELVDFLHLGVSLIEAIQDQELRDTETTIWWTRLFKYTLHLNLVDDAFMAIMNHKDEPTAKACLHQLVVCMYARNQLQRLVQLPYNSYLNEVKQILLRLAKTCDIVGVVLDDQTTYYEVLYSIFVFQHDYRTAAAMMAEFAEHLNKLAKPDDFEAASVVFSAQRDAYLSAVNALSLVRPADRWIAIEAVDTNTTDATAGTHDPAKRKRHVDDLDDESSPNTTAAPAMDEADEQCSGAAVAHTCVFSVQDLKRRYALTQAHLDLLAAKSATAVAAEYDVLRLPSAETAIRLLAHHRRFDDAAALAVAFNLHSSVEAMAPIFEQLAEQVMTLQLQPDAPCEWLGFVQRVPRGSGRDDARRARGQVAPGLTVDYGEASGASAYDRACGLLERFLRTYDSPATAYRFHAIAIDKALSSQLNLDPHAPGELPAFLTSGLMRLVDRRHSKDTLASGGDPALLMRLYARHDLLAKALGVAAELYATARQWVGGSSALNAGAAQAWGGQRAPTTVVCLPHSAVEEVKALAKKADGNKQPDVAAALEQLQTEQRKYAQRLGVVDSVADAL